MTNRIICPECAYWSHCVPNSLTCDAESEAQARAQMAEPDYMQAWIAGALEVFQSGQRETDSHDRTWQQTTHTQGLWYFHQADNQRPLTLTEKSQALISGVTWAGNTWPRANIMYIASSDGLLSIFKGMEQRYDRLIEALDIRTSQGRYTLGLTGHDDDGGTIIAFEDDNLDSESREYLRVLCARNRSRPMGQPMYQIFVATAHSIQVPGAI